MNILVAAVSVVVTLITYPLQRPLARWRAAHAEDRLARLLSDRR